MKKKATIILFPPQKTLEIDFLDSLTEQQKFQFYQIMEIMLHEELEDSNLPLKKMLQKTIKDQQKEILRLREEIKNLTKDE